MKLQLQRLHWSFGFTEISPFPLSTRCFQNTKKLYFDSMKRKTRMEGQIYDSWWQHQMSVRALRHDRPSGRRAQPKPQYPGYLPIGWIVKVISYLIRLLRYPLCIRSWCTFFPQNQALWAKVNYCMEINGKKEEILGLPLACEQALCFWMGWKNREEREGNRWEPVEKHLRPLFRLPVL